MNRFPNCRAFIFDLDGTLYHGDSAIPGAREFLARLDQQDLPYVFATNRANRTPDAVAAQLTDMGIDCHAGQVLTSALATAEYLPPCSAYVIGQPALLQALMRQGIRIVDAEPDCVVVGFDEQLTYQKLADACHWLLRGARYVATNPDDTFNTPRGIAPENGAVIAALHAASGRRPEIVGKPEAPLFASARRRLNALYSGLDADYDDLCMIGDNPHTDILGARRLGIKSILMLTGLARADSRQPDRQADVVAEDYGYLSELLFGQAGC